MNCPPASAFSKRFALLTCLVSAAALLLAANTAGAAWPTGASLASGSLTAVPAVQSTTPVSNSTVSDDGHYAFFFSSSPALNATASNGGVFRKNLWSDAAPLDLVAKQPALVSGVQCGIAGFISVSANGRYVAFASGENSLVAADSNGRRDVFVRDMNIAIGAAGAYEVASSPDGSVTPAAYTLADGGGSGLPIPATQNCLYGAQLPGPNSLSNDGKRVLFSSTAFTNISAVSAGTSTAPGQLWVRSLSPDAPSTLLVTKVAYNITYNIPGLADPAQSVGDPLPDQEYFDDDPDTSARTLTFAAISGDGATVVWAGPFARNQAAYHRGENVTQNGLGSFDSINYLYRRVADGASAKTRRVVSWSDLDDVACDPNLGGMDFSVDPEGAKQTACAGPVSSESIPQSFATVPSITDDGRKVFALVGLPGRNLTELLSTYPLDVVSVDMTPGVARKNGYHWITRDTNAAGPYPIIAMASSGDGKQVAILTARRDFSSTGLVQSGSFPATTGGSAAMFVIDGTSGFAAAPIEWTARPGSSTDVPNSALDNLFALSGNGDTLVFASSEATFFAGHNGQEQTLCVKRGGACSTTPAAAAPTVSVTSPVNASTIASPASGAYVTSGAGSVTCQWDSEAALSPCPSSSLAPKSLGAGPHTFSVTATNATGSTTVTNSFTVGDLPSATITAPSEGAAVSSPVSPAYTTNGATSVVCWYDQTAWLNPCPASPPAKTLANGAHTFNVKVTNAAGSVTVTRNFTIGAAAPGVTINAPASGGTVGSPVTASFTVSGATSVTCQWDSESVINACTSPQGPKALAAGPHTFKLSATNAQGTTNVTSSFTVVAPPTVTINTPADGDTVVSPVSGSFTLGGGAANSVTCQWDSETAITGCTTPVGPKTLTAGPHSFKVTATNAAGSASVTRNFTVAPVPSVAINSPAEGSSLASPVTADFTASNATSVTCQWDSEAVINGCTSPQSGKVLAPGPHTFRVSATNASGTTTVTNAFTVAGLPAVTINVPANGATTTSPVAASFSATGTTSVTCQWDSEAVINSCASPLAGKALADGAHAFKVSATNIAGTTTVVSDFTVKTTATPPPAPPASPAEPSPTINSFSKVLKPGAADITLSLVGSGPVKAAGTAKLPKGKKLKPSAAGSGAATANGSGSVKLTFKLNSAARKYLAKKGKLTVSVKLTFTPASGEPVVRTLSIGFKAKKK